MELVLPTTARARGTDPETSHQAAGSISAEKLLFSQRAVAWVFRWWAPPGGMTDHTLMEIYGRRMHWPQQSPSGIRTRRRELADLGLIVDTGRKERLPSGRFAVVWNILYPSRLFDDLTNNNLGDFDE